MRRSSTGGCKFSAAPESCEVQSSLRPASKGPLMKRILLPALALAAVLALPATASAFRGVAVAKTPARPPAAPAPKAGPARPVRPPGHLAAIRVGSRVSYTARRLADGTFRA